MSIGTESMRNVIVTIRVIKVLLPKSFNEKKPILIINFGKESWRSSRDECSLKINWKQSHTFEIDEVCHMYIGVFYKKNLFKESEFCSCIVKSENFSAKKGIKFTEIGQYPDKLTVFWTYVIEETRKGENTDLLVLINEVEAEREEVKYKKSKVEERLRRIKGKRYECKKNIKNLQSNFHPILGILAMKTSDFNSQAKRSESRRLHSQGIDIIDEISDY